MALSYSVDQQQTSYPVTTMTKHQPPLSLVECNRFTMEHVEQFLILQHDGALHQILKVRVHPSSDPCVLGHPLLSQHINVVSHLDGHRQTHTSSQTGERLDGQLTASRADELDGQKHSQLGEPTSPMSERVFHSERSARLATSSNMGSPVRRLRVANSRMKVPTPAVQVTGVSVGLTPLRRFTVP